MRDIAQIAVRPEATRALAETAARDVIRRSRAGRGKRCHALELPRENTCTFGLAIKRAPTRVLQGNAWKTIGFFSTYNS
jgi:hypothetical protein